MSAHLRPVWLHQASPARGPSNILWALVVFSGLFASLTALAFLSGVRLPAAIFTPAFMAAGAAVLTYASRRSWGDRSSTRDLVWVNGAAVVMGALSIPYLIWFANQHKIDSEFYFVTAQVIPVLILALLIDIADYSSGDKRGLLFIVVIAFLGEGLALTSGAAVDTAGSAGFALTSGSIVTQAFALVFSVMSRTKRNVGDAVDVSPTTPESLIAAENKIRGSRAAILTCSNIAAIAVAVIFVSRWNRRK